MKSVMIATPALRIPWRPLVRLSRHKDTLLALLLLTVPAHAQDDEDHRRVCPLLTQDDLRIIIPAVTGQGGCKVFCTGCGCKGGPGYRDAQHRCVGYGNLIQKCGPPPHAGCTAECAPVRPGCDHGRVWVKNTLAHSGLSVDFIDAAPSTPAQQQPLQGADQTGDGQSHQ
jgi:hypothetical protein